jgi:diadenosine tetraphosphate (Ap4A) HIT family hydrolase
MDRFEPDPRLIANTLPVAMLETGPLRLMDDRRWPWLILIPAIPGAAELHDLPSQMAADIHTQTGRIGAAFKRVTGCTKINTGALGNIVRQLHIHVIARSEGDANWPGPVWGFGEREPWPPGEARKLIERIKTELNA